MWFYLPGKKRGQGRLWNKQRNFIVQCCGSDSCSKAGSGTPPVRDSTLVSKSLNRNIVSKRSPAHIFFLITNSYTFAFKLHCLSCMFPLEKKNNQNATKKWDYNMVTFWSKTFAILRFVGHFVF